MLILEDGNGLRGWRFSSEIQNWFFQDFWEFGVESHDLNFVRRFLVSWNYVAHLGIFGYTFFWFEGMGDLGMFLFPSFGWYFFDFLRDLGGNFETMVWIQGRAIADWGGRISREIWGLDCWGFWEVHLDFWGLNFWGLREFLRFRIEIAGNFGRFVFDFENRIEERGL